jgi:Flp pilus assembly protein TadG
MAADIYRRVAGGGPERARRRVRDERGVALIEFALVAPILFLVLFAIVDFGRVLNYRQDASHLTAEGARFASVNKCPGTPPVATCLQRYLVEQAAADELSQGSGSVTDRLEICIAFPEGATAAKPVTVSASFDFTFLPILNFADFTKPIDASSTMRLEADATQFQAGCYQAP